MWGASAINATGRTNEKQKFSIRGKALFVPEGHTRRFTFYTIFSRHHRKQLYLRGLKKFSLSFGRSRRERSSTGKSNDNYKKHKLKLRTRSMENTTATTTTMRKEKKTRVKFSIVYCPGWNSSFRASPRSPLKLRITDEKKTEKREWARKLDVCSSAMIAKQRPSLPVPSFPPVDITLVFSLHFN